VVLFFTRLLSCEDFGRTVGMPRLTVFCGLDAADDASRWAPVVTVSFVLVVEDEVGHRYLVWEPSLVEL
jgi:hypothetical protein